MVPGLNTWSRGRGLAILLLLAQAAALPGERLSGQARGGTPPLQVPEGAAFVASSRGSVYYPVACSSWHRLAPANVRFFRSEEEARARGYEPTTSGACRAAFAAHPGADPVVCVVERVVDGDTVRCRGGETVRLLLVDAPEEAQGDFALRATLALQELLPPGDSAALELDVQARDRYGRLLAHLHSGGGEWVNRSLARRGYAVPLVYPPNVRHVEAIRAAADSAREERRGLWERDAFACLPVDFRAGRCR